MMKHFVFRIAVSCLLFAAQVPAHAQWTQVTKSSSSDGVSCFAQLGTHLFSGTWNGVFLRSDDTGLNWLGDSGFDYVNCFSTIGRNVIMATWKGVFFSTDSGESWNASINIWSGPLNPVVAIVAIGPNLYAFNNGDEGETSGFVSIDSGNSWNAIPQPPSDISTALANDGNLFAGLEGGIFLSTDSGNTWFNRTDGLKDSSIWSLACADSCIFAVAANDSWTSSIIELSQDNGLSWNPTKAVLSRGSPYKLAVTNIHASNPTMIVGGDSGVFFSTNNGDSWVDAGLPNYNIQSIATMGNYLFAGTYQYGLWRRSISEMIGAAAVAPSYPVEQSITAYPNPCTSSSTITFSCQESGAGEVTILNLLGAEVARVYEGELSLGQHSFTWDASGAAPGMYECIVRVNGNVQHIPLAHVSEP